MDSLTVEWELPEMSDKLTMLVIIGIKDWGTFFKKPGWYRVGVMQTACLGSWKEFWIFQIQSEAWKWRSQEVVWRRRSVRRCCSCIGSEGEMEFGFFISEERNKAIGNGKWTSSREGRWWPPTLQSSEDHFYRAIHCCAKRGIEIACRLSVCPSVFQSVTLVDQDHISWKSWKLIDGQLVQHLRSS